jgi:hypothetical protein
LAETLNHYSGWPRYQPVTKIRKFVASTFDWYNSLTGIELSAEFKDLAGAAIGREASHQIRHFCPKFGTSFPPH